MPSKEDCAVSARLLSQPPQKGRTPPFESVGWQDRPCNLQQCYDIFQSLKMCGGTAIIATMCLLCEETMHNLGVVTNSSAVQFRRFKRSACHCCPSNIGSGCCHRPKSGRVLGSACYRHDLQHTVWLLAERGMQVHSATMGFSRKKHPSSVAWTDGKQGCDEHNLIPFGNCLTAWVAVEERGFVPKRNLAAKVINAAAQMRRVSMEVFWSDRLCAMALGCTTAFPSISRQ